MPGVFANEPFVAVNHIRINIFNWLGQAQAHAGPPEKKRSPCGANLKYCKSRSRQKATLAGP
jgi:hypothetical protein